MSQITTVKLQELISHATSTLGELRAELEIHETQKPPFQAKEMEALESWISKKEIWENEIEDTAQNFDILSIRLVNRMRNYQLKTCIAAGCERSKQNSPNSKKLGLRKAQRGLRDFCKPHWFEQKNV